MPLTPDTLRKRAKKSLEGSAGWVRVEGVGKVYAESFDTEDTFAPAIAGYDLKDGYLVYQGRNGSVGAVLGPPRALAKWTLDVERWKKWAPVLGKARLWRPMDGGGELLREAMIVARRVFRGIRIKFLVIEGSSTSSGECHAGRATVINAHLPVMTEIAGSRMHGGSKVAAHEAAHAAFSLNPEAGREVIAVLGSMNRPITAYHALAGNFEGAMDAAAWWALDPSAMQRKAPRLFQAVQNWLG